MSQSNSAPSPSVLSKWASLSSLHESYTQTRGNSLIMLKNYEREGGGLFAHLLALGHGCYVFVLWRHYYHVHIFSLSRLQEDACFFFMFLSNTVLTFKRETGQFSYELLRFLWLQLHNSRRRDAIPFQKLLISLYLIRNPPPFFGLLVAFSCL